jgi:phosphate/sulfate permease
MTIPLLTIFAVTAVAFANGANDVSKGIATLAGSRRATYRRPPGGIVFSVRSSVMSIIEGSPGLR